MNMLVAELAFDDAGQASVSFGEHRLAVPDIVLRKRPALKRYDGRRLVLGIRPEDMEDAEIVGAADGSTLRSVADLVEAMGADVMVHFPVDAEPVRTEDREPLGPGVRLRARRRRAAPCWSAGSARAPGSSRASPSTVRVDTEGLHFFDLGHRPLDLAVTECDGKQVPRRAGHGGSRRLTGCGGPAPHARRPGPT